ncbi:MAG TPA: phytanoyl-CoA dioxygenase family protein [Pelobium sp.]|nr:phytanoyl-CoA dioxygenase family protein [Pelobium sp.]
MDNKFSYAAVSAEKALEIIDDFGWIVYENALEPEFVTQINDTLQDAYERRKQIQIINGIEQNMEGTLHHLIEPGSFALKFLDRMYCDKEMKLFLKGNYIVNAFGGVINNKDNRPYVQNIHRDVRTFCGGEKTMVQMMVLLDDFTAENGATYMLSGSHKIADRPSSEYFYENADRVLAKKGSIVLFDSNLWHAAGKNTTEGNRRVLTLSYTRPNFKQQLDYPRFLGYEFGEMLNDDLRQVIGYKSRVPANLYEYYQPLSKRMYQPDQG